MTQVNNHDPTINLSPNLCDYCHQRPKFPPYNYCGRTCGARAAAVGSRAAGSVVMCKQCNQRPVYRNHQFCGRNCADAWTAVHGQINTVSLGALWPSSWYQNQQTVQGGGQPGQKQGGISGFVKGFKSFVSQTNQTQPQQQQTVMNPAQTQQPSNNAIDPTSIPGTLATAPPITAISSATSNQLTPGTSQHPSTLPTKGGTPNQSNSQLGPFNRTYPISSLPTNSTSSGSSVPNNTNLDPSRAMPTAAWNAMGFPSHSAGSLGYTSELDNPNTDTVPGQSSYPDRDPSEDGDWEDGEDEVSVGDVDVQSIENIYPPSISTSESSGTCGLEGCSNPTFVDSITDLESEYCSRKHREEAVVSKEAASCIMCHKVPRGPNDHFCSTTCRGRALRP